MVCQLSSLSTCFMDNVLYVSDVKRNLLSISQLLKDNSALKEFHSSFYVRKDLNTHKVLLRGQLKDDLYQIDLRQDVRLMDFV